MKIARLTTSLVALSLFAMPVVAQATRPASDHVRLAQATTELPAAVQTLLQDTRPASELSDDELKQRFRQARGFVKAGTLPKDKQRALQSLMRQDRLELAARGQGGGKNKQGSEPAQAGSQEQAPADKAADEAAGSDQSASDQPSSDVSVASGKAPAGVEEFLKDGRPASALSDAELRQRFQQARRYLKNEALSAEMKQAVRTIAKQARLEIAARAQGGKQQQTGDASSGGGDQGGATEPGQKTMPIGTQIPDDVLAMIKDTRQPSELSDAELKTRLQTARNFIQNGNPPKDVRRQVVEVLKGARAETLKRGQGKSKPAKDQAGSDTSTQDQTAVSGGAGADKDQKGKPAGNAMDADAEAKAKAFLGDTRKAEDLSTKELHDRLGAIRELLAANQLSRDTERALRMKLKDEREVMRRRVAKSENGGGGGKPTADGSDTGDTKVILADNRDADQLDDAALRIRINVYRNVIIDVRFTEQERQRWRKILERDRIVLRDRLIAARRHRADNLKHGDVKININLNLDFQPGRPPMRDVFAAEVDDEQIEDVLLAPPRRKVERRYTIEEVEASPQLRDVVARIEIDTVHFGFGEAFVREEEVESLDRIAEIMERILAVHPREVFLIEGHTDAVGSDAANLELSRQRARAIKQALTTYYVIPDGNLKTIGYGERFLKIPTEEAEAENRRVSIARATVLLGEAEQ